MNTPAVKLKWRDRTSTETAQFVYRSTEPLDVENLPEPIAILEPNVQEYLDEDVTSNTIYYYIIGNTNGSKFTYSEMHIVDLNLPIMGPGPQTFVGFNDDRAGFFGEVPNTELITPVNLATQLGLTQGTAQNLDTPWLKFYLDGRILYVAKKTIRHTISYDHLRDLGLVDGSKIIIINGLQYRVGLLSGIDDGYTGAVGVEYNAPYAARSEWTRLMYNVASDTGITTDRQKQGQIGDNWVEYPQDSSTNGLNTSAGNGRFSWTKEINPANSTQAVGRGNSSLTHIYPAASSYAPASYGWRPRLELVTR